jgi:hypothetical protein
MLLTVDIFDGQQHLQLSPFFLAEIAVEYDQLLVTAALFLRCLPTLLLLQPFKGDNFVLFQTRRTVFEKMAVYSLKLYVHYGSMGVNAKW